VKNNTEKKWYALYVNVRHEKKIMHKLLEKGMEAYVPIVKEMRQWSDRKKMVEAPLFTGYVFVKIHAADMDKPRWVEGVINYLRFEGKPALIRDEEIEGLKFFVNNGYNIAREADALKPGQKVKINLSQFKDFMGIVETVAENENVMVSFEGIKQNIVVKAPSKAVKAV
jgi:transcription termination/antitermination protein NusG